MARFDSISSASIMGKYDPGTATIRISDQVDDPFLTGLHEAMHALDSLRSGKMRSLDDDAYSKSVISSVRKKLGASSKTSFSDLVTLFAGLNVKRANGYMKEPWELLPIAAENHYTGKRDKLTMAILEEVNLYD